MSKYTVFFTNGHVVTVLAACVNSAKAEGTKVSNFVVVGAKLA